MHEKNDLIIFMRENILCNIYVKIRVQNLSVSFKKYVSNIFTFFYLYMLEKVLFQGHIFELEISMDLHVLRPPLNPRIIFLAVGLCIVCYQHNSKANYDKNIMFGVLPFLSHVDATWNFSWRLNKNYVYVQEYTHTRAHKF